MADITGWYGFWEFDYYLTDATGNNRNLEQRSNNAGLFLPGKLSGCYSTEIQSSGGLREITPNYDNSFSNNGTGDLPFSMVGWFMYNNYPTAGSVRGLFTKFWTTNGGYGIVVRPEDSFKKIHFELHSTLNSNILGVKTTNDVIPENVWFHVAVTYDAINRNGGQKIYFNGVEVPTTVSNTGSYTNLRYVNDYVAIGMYLASSVTTGTNMRADNCGIMPRVLTKEEIEQIYYKGIGQPYPFSKDPNQGGIMNFRYY